MVYLANGQAVQVLPITPQTFIGVPTNQECSKQIVHMSEEGAVTFHFASGDKVIALAPAGIDFIADESCTGVTSLVSVIIS